MKIKEGIYKLTLLLIFLDQGIKLIIKNFFYEDKFNIIGDLLVFNPILNTKYSWYNSKFNLGIGKLAHIIFVIVLIIIFAALYMYIKEKLPYNKAFVATSTFLFAGAICSLSDKIFWGGSLDFIQLKTFFTFDFKDIYVNLANLGLIYLGITNYKYIEKIESMDLLRDIKKYFISKIKRENGNI